jgi:hypothetical protein
MDDDIITLCNKGLSLIEKATILLNEKIGREEASSKMYEPAPSDAARSAQAENGT